MMLNGINRMKRKLSKRLSGKVLTDFLQDAVRNEKVFATARTEAAKAKSKSMMGNQYRKNSKKPPSTDPNVNRSRERSIRTNARNRLIAHGLEISPELQVRRSCNNPGAAPLKTEVSKSAEERRLGRQRAKLRKNGEKVLTGAFSNAEVDLYIESHPDAIFVYHCPSSWK